MVVFSLEKIPNRSWKHFFSIYDTNSGFFSLGDGCSFPTCLVNQDPEQASTPGGLNSTSKK